MSVRIPLFSCSARSYKEAMESKDWRLWNAASDEEMESLKKNHTWDYVERPKDHKVIGCKWIHKLKPGILGVEKPRHKSRLVAKGYAQTEGIDYNEVFAPVVKHVSIRLLLYTRQTWTRAGPVLDTSTRWEGIQ